jgi:hypothetical protein
MALITVQLRLNYGNALLRGNCKSTLTNAVALSAVLAPPQLAAVAPIVAVLVARASKVLAVAPTSVMVILLRNSSLNKNKLTAVIYAEAATVATVAAAAAAAVVGIHKL